MNTPTLGHCYDTSDLNRVVPLHEADLKERMEIMRSYFRPGLVEASGSNLILAFESTFGLHFAPEQRRYVSEAFEKFFGDLKKPESSLFLLDLSDEGQQVQIIRFWLWYWRTEARTSKKPIFLVMFTNLCFLPLMFL